MLIFFDLREEAVWNNLKREEFNCSSLTRNKPINSVYSDLSSTIAAYALQFNGQRYTLTSVKLCVLLRINRTSSEAHSNMIWIEAGPVQADVHQ